MTSLSDTYRTRFTELHAAVATLPLGETPLTSFWPMVGARYDGELVVVGRAVNSWRTEWTVGQAHSPDDLDRVVADAIATNTVGPDPMDWVNRLWGNEGTRFDGFDSGHANLPVGGHGVRR